MIDHTLKVKQALGLVSPVYYWKYFGVTYRFRNGALEWYKNGTWSLCWTGYHKNSLKRFSRYLQELLYENTTPQGQRPFSAHFVESVRKATTTPPEDL